ncbi:MAG: RdgB/HAM1 family non-canonical purine NTP pyrophosphatase [Oscillospiraceae bacterium]|nr:RdgB/HAM1 family non-canonical purine NTP pyrophosphatase [Oscillospiraceae bacterium]
MRLILASNNKNKLREIQEMLSPIGYEVISQSQAGIDMEAEENGSTFEENAAIKADAIYALTHTAVIADDSGLEVDALGGAPGIYSARYAPKGQGKKTLLANLEGVPDDKRTARFVCVICYIDPDGEKHYFRGECEGKIGYECIGESGFGYDPIFMYGDRSFAQLSADEKNAVSHRSMAIIKLREYLESAVKGGNA